MPSRIDNFNIHEIFQNEPFTQDQTLKKSPKKCTSLVLLLKKERVPGPPPFQSPTFVFGIAEVPLITKYLPCESFVRRCHRKVLTLQEVAWCISYLWIWSTCWDPVSTKVGEKTSLWFELKIKDLNGTWSWDLIPTVSEVAGLHTSMEGSQTHLMQEGLVDFGLQVDKGHNSSKSKATSISCVYSY